MYHFNEIYKLVQSIFSRRIYSRTGYRAEVDRRRVPTVYNVTVVLSLYQRLYLYRNTKVVDGEDVIRIAVLCRSQVAFA